jgi:hypothetical protein
MAPAHCHCVRQVLGPPVLRRTDRTFVCKAFVAVQLHLGSHHGRSSRACALCFCVVFTLVSSYIFIYSLFPSILSFCSFYSLSTYYIFLSWLTFCFLYPPRLDFPPPNISIGSFPLSVLTAIHPLSPTFH